MATTAHHDRRKLVRLGLGALVGAAIAVLVPTPEEAGLVSRVLLGFTVAALSFAVPMIVRMLRATPEETQDYVDGLDPGRSLSDVIVTVSSVAALLGVGLMLVGEGGGSKDTEALISVGAVGSAWLLIHTVFAMRYARHWFNAEPDSVDFNMDGPPAYSDFLYLGFAIGVSFAVSDTNLKTTRIRRIALRHSWLSYLFGTVIVATVINLLAGLAG